MGDNTGAGGPGSGSGAPAPLAAAAGSGSGMNVGALSAEAPPFRPGSQQFGTSSLSSAYHGASPAFHQQQFGGPQLPLPFPPPGQQFRGPQLPPAFPPPAGQFCGPPTLPYLFRAAHFGFNPTAAMGRGSDLPEHHPSMQSPVGTSSGSGSGSRPPLHGPSSPGLGSGSSSSLHAPSSPAGLGSGPGSGPPLYGPSSSPAGLGQTHPAHSTVTSLQDLSTQTRVPKVDNLNLPQDRTAYVPPTSLSIAPGSQSGPSSASGAGTPKPSYSAMAMHGNTAAEMNKWKSKLLNYLTRDDCYNGKASTSGAQLEVEFQDILVKDKELAVKLCNAQGTNDFWLNQAAAEFFKKSGVSTAGTASFFFKDTPTRLTAARQVLKAKARSKHTKICNNAKTIDVATTHGRQTLDIIICGMLEKLAKRESWHGDLSIDDLMLAEYANGEKKLIITKDPVVKGNSTVGERLNDLWAVWRAVQPFYLIGDKLPLYFERLQMDLLTATHLQEWFVQYIQYHPAFYASNPRKNLICGIQQEASSKTPNSLSLSAFLNVSPSHDGDWRLHTQNGVLHSIFSYQERKEQEWKAKQQKLKGGAVPVEYNHVNPYLDSTLSLLTFQRNGLQHPYDHALMSDKDELELLLAATFEDFLPDMIRGLLSMCNMDGQFASDWSTYRASKSDDKEPPFVGSHQHRLE